MLSVNLYQDQEEIYQMAFLEHQGLPLTIVCPNPGIADDIRSKISGFEGEEERDVITISKFMGDQFKAFFPEQKIARKSELLMDLGTLWKLKFADYPDETFFLVFQLFTELRSFTLSGDLIEEIHKEFESHVAGALELFWRYLETVDYCDEQKSYGLLTEAYRDLDEISQKDQEKLNLVFYGFSHISASQVDLIKSLGIFHDVYVPVPEKVYKGSLPTDWTMWFDCDIHNESNDFFEETSKLNVLRFSKNRLSEKVLSLIRKEKNLSEELDFILASKHLAFDHYNEIPIKSAYFKVNSPLFLESLDEILDSIKKQFQLPVDGIALIDFMTETSNKILQAEDKNFRKLKVLHAAKKIIEDWMEKSGINEKVGLFDLKILKGCLELDLPRSSMSPLLKKDPTIFLKGIEGVDTVRESSQKIICTSGAYAPLKGGDGQYGEDILNFLSAIGPVKRRDLEFQYLKLKLKKILSEEDTILLLEDGLEERDPAWNEILSEFELEYLDFPHSTEENQGTDYLASTIEYQEHKIYPISASRLQTYLDCPRKYYLQYVSRAYEQPEIRNVIQAKDLGSLQHEIIKAAYEQNIDADGVELQNICRDSLIKHIAKNDISLNQVKIDSYYFEIYAYVKNGLTSILQIKKIIPDAQFKFEEELTAEGVSGSIDCFFKWKNYYGIIDFKRSSSSIPNPSEIDRFDKIQIWYYLLNCGFPVSDVRMWGFLNLSEIKDSLVYGSIPMSTEHPLNFEMLDFPENFEERISDFRQFLTNLKDKMINDKTFKAAPRKNDVCLYCPYARVCDKGGNK